MIFVDLQEQVNSAELPQQWDLLRRKVNDVKLSLPPQAQLTIVQDEFSEVYGMLFSLYGDSVAMAELKDHARELQRRLKAIEGVKKIQLHGIQEQVINIDVDDERLAQATLTTLQLFEQLGSQNLPLHSGDFAMGIEQIRVEQAGRSAVWKISRTSASKPASMVWKALPCGWVISPTSTSTIRIPP